MRYHLTPVRMANINNSRKTDVGKDVEKGEPLSVLAGIQTGAATLENSVEVPQKLKNRTTLRLSNYITRYLSKRYKNTDLKRHTRPNVYSSTTNNR